MFSKNYQDAIEQEFFLSWDGMEQFFGRHCEFPDWEWLKPILELIAELRKRGYDRKLRAGQSMWLFCLSRSRQHGLRLEQPSIRIELFSEGGMRVSYLEAGELKGQMDFEQIEVTPEVEDLLMRLLEQPID